MGVLALSLLFSFRAEDMNMADMAGMIKLGVDQVNRIYPLAGMYTAGTVSYTHLDVYKRQHNRLLLYIFHFTEEI